ncbi:MAG: DUF2169 family type VI secretion system accessory protein [Cellvibrionaceae bacterium]
MNITNNTPYQAEFNPGMMPDGRTCLIVVIKATYDLPDANLSKQDGSELTLSEKQIELYESDAFTGDPGESSPLAENDYATFKPKCDVILQQATAYAPEGKPATSLTVSLQCASINKSFLVLGPRRWEKKTLGLLSQPSEPQAFLEQALSWEIAYGGIDHNAYPDQEEEDDRKESYAANPIGIGYWRQPDNTQIEHTPIAQTEIIGQAINKPKERHQPQGFGPVARSWPPRSQYGGTYDDHWEQNTKPFLPDDFDSLYYQCAPADQQMPYPKGGEEVTLTNLNPEGLLQFTLPVLDVSITTKLRNRSEQILEPVIDTITINTSNNTLTLVARAHHPLKNTIHEVSEFVVDIAASASKTEDIPSPQSEKTNEQADVHYYDATQQNGERT